MAQPTSLSIRTIRRKPFLGLGVAIIGIGIVGLTVVVAREATGSDDFRQKLLLSIVDKLVLGGVVVLVGYFFQKRLELFKRDQGLATELAKVRIAAYNRAIAAVHSFDYATFILLELGAEHAAEKEKKAKATKSAAVREAAETYEKESKALLEILKSDRYLLGDAFCLAVNQLQRQARSDVTLMKNGAPIDADARARQKTERRRLLESIPLYLPPFANPPKEDLHFTAPNFDNAQARLTKKD